MSDPTDINDRLDAAATKAEGGATIFHDVANGPEGSYISTESGLLPSIAEWLRLNAASLGGVPAIQAFIADLQNTTDPNKGVSQVGRAIRRVGDVAALSTTPGRYDADEIDLTSYYGGWAAFAIPNPVGGGRLVWHASSTDTANNGTCFAVTGVSTGRWKRRDQIFASTSEWGCYGDRVHDDTVRLQAAINWCTSFSKAVPLAFDGQCRITASLKVNNRLVDTTKSEWVWFSRAAAGGLYSDTASLTMIDSDAIVTTDPLVEFITFNGIQLEANNASTSVKAMSKKFLRCKFNNCYFLYTAFGASDIYMQSMYFDHCNIRFWPGTWLVADAGFDLKFSGNISEFGNGYLISLINGTYSVAISGGVHEGSVGGLIAAGRCNKLSISDYYIEHNAAVGIDLTGGAQNNAPSVKDCFFSSTSTNIANTNFYEIDWGNSVGAVSEGNRHYDGRLHANASVQGGLISTGDVAAVALFKAPLNVTETSGTWTPTTSIGTGTINSATFVRSGKRIRARFSITFSGTSGSPAQILGLPYTADQSLFSGTVTYTDLAGGIYLIGGTGLSPGTATSFILCSTQTGTPITFTTLSGKTVVGQIEYTIT